MHSSLHHQLAGSVEASSGECHPGTASRSLQARQVATGPTGTPALADARSRFPSRPGSQSNDVFLRCHEWASTSRTRHGPHADHSASDPASPCAPGPGANTTASRRAPYHAAALASARIDTPCSPINIFCGHLCKFLRAWGSALPIRPTRISARQLNRIGRSANNPPAV
jgi:hypothetical protein